FRAMLVDAKLNHAKLVRVRLRGANLNGAIAEGAIFSKVMGISDQEKRDLMNRGAVFQELAEAVPSPIA
ncbi:MAG TPA: pentapeptide repeat-containing protein, partial [Vampirovibrionales bacterium]